MLRMVFCFFVLLLLAGWSVAGEDEILGIGIPEGPRPLAIEPHGAEPMLPNRTWTPLDVPDAGIARMIDGIEAAELLGEVEWLIGLGNRYTEGRNINTVADSLQARFAALGLATEQHGFNYYSYSRNNVVATQVGTVYPDSFFVICAHYDAISEDPQNLTPGADDNGTGVATVLKAADLLASRTTDYSIKYVLFAAEEQGMWGSQFWVTDQVAANLPIVGALNCDMFGWWTPGVPFNLEVETNAHSRWIADAIVNAAELYTEMPVLLHQGENYYWGDFYRFWQNGYACVSHEESFDWGDPDFNPYYHSTGDVVGNLSSEMFTGSAKVVIAGLATLVGINGYETPVDEIAAAKVSFGAYPNPFNAQTTIWMQAAVADQTVQLGFYDLSGRRVGTTPLSLVSGMGRTHWNGLDAQGAALPSGIYFYRAELGSRIATGRIQLLK